MSFEDKHERRPNKWLYFSALYNMNVFDKTNWKLVAGCW